jgi:hypothetical protein
MPTLCGESAPEKAPAALSGFAFGFKASSLNMPNRTRRDKRKPGNGADRTRRKRQTAAQSAGALLAAGGTLLPGLNEQLALQKFWAEWLATRLPALLAAKLAGVVERDGCLTLLAVSGAWAARLRYALQEIEPEIRAHAPQLGKIRVRVMPPK